MRLANVCVAALLLGAASGRAAEAGRWSLGPTMSYGIKADFRRLASFSALTDPGAAAAGADHFYDDGFNRVDSTGNSDRGTGTSQTTFWSYQSASQVLASGGQIEMHSRSLGATGVLRADCGPSPGLELNYERALGKVGRGAWGVRLSGSWLQVGVDEGRTFTTAATVLTDTYTVIAPPAPTAPYTGTFTGPGSTLGDTPMRAVTTEANGAMVDGLRTVEADVALVRLGPWVELPLGSRFMVQAGAGAAFGAARSSFSFQETTTVRNVDNLPLAQSAQGATRNSAFLTGGYVDVAASVRINPNVSLRGSVAQQWMDGWRQSTGGREVRVGFDSVQTVSVALSVNF